MAQGVIRSLVGDRNRGIGYIRPLTVTGAEVVGQDLFFNTAQVLSAGAGDAPLSVGDVVSYTYTRALNRGGGGAAVAVDIERLTSVPQDDEPGPPAGAVIQATGQNADPSVEAQLRATGIYAAI